MPAGGKRSKGGEAVREGRKDSPGRRNDSGAEERSALDRGPTVGSPSRPKAAEGHHSAGEDRAWGTAWPGAHHSACTGGPKETPAAP